MNYPKPDDASTHPSPRTPKQNASWLIPRGVSKGNWDYVRSNHISQGYDEFLKGDPLTAADRQIINRYFPEVRNEHSMPNPIVADFGCGNGRTLAPLLTRGYRGLGIDLSIPMLTGFAENRRDKSPEIDSLVLVQANLVELDGIGDDTVDHGISLFSTLGMIEGARNRAAFLGHARRIIKPGVNSRMARGVAFIVSTQFLGGMKMWYFLELNKLASARDIRRLELRMIEKAS